MNQKFPFLIRCVSFLLLTLIVASLLGNVLIKPYHSDIHVLERMIKDHEDFDIVIMSSSHGYCAFDPIIIDALLSNSKTSSLSMPNLSLAHISLLLQQMVEENKAPDVVVLEMFSFLSKMENTTQTSFFNDYSKTWSPPYLSQIMSFYSPEQLLYPLFPLLNQHENWKNAEILSRNLINSPNKQERIEDEILQNLGYQNKGFRPVYDLITPEAYQYGLDHPSEILPTKANLLGLEKILRISQDYGIQLIFLGAPYPAGYYPDYSRLEQVEKDYNITVHNLNLTHQHVFSPFDYLNEGHVNHHGAVKSSLILSNILAQETQRSFDHTLAEEYRSLQIAAIHAAETSEGVKVTLLPAQLSSNWQVQWQVIDVAKQNHVLESSQGESLTFVFHPVYLLSDTIHLLITITQEGLDYPLTLELTSEHFPPASAQR